MPYSSKIQGHRFLHFVTHHITTNGIPVPTSPRRFAFDSMKIAVVKSSQNRHALLRYRNRKLSAISPTRGFNMSNDAKDDSFEEMDSEEDEEVTIIDTQLPSNWLTAKTLEILQMNE
ncbi:Hypothetical predicted protein [Octopus vulgaris]|uniref:Uncharacterized protein n=1 Tax=Octopus vulgaris TaxID=6645 RepID=A0AA36EYP4_OCTVU|nr:Hypothetical predicted protein [Octopus vulgaris]